ncbi:hypothetical protein HGRIS_000323 [Hohenbuehelia grisea]|uniref:DUF155 domain-containing protein n=1 Tax=Hohenbuehelia grisea TaxID=104357 RepID=A0ABR3JS34_9AGAR
MPPPNDASGSKPPQKPAQKPPQQVAVLEPKARGANRSTKVAGKLKVLPEQPEPPVVLGPQFVRPREDTEGSVGTTGDSDDADADTDEEDEPEVEVYNQISLIPDGTAKRDALRLTKKKAKSLPRVTAYATASSYRLEELMKFFNARRNAYHTDAKLIDEVIYTPYIYDPPAPEHSDVRNSRSVLQLKPQGDQTGDLLGVPELIPGHESTQEGPRKPKKRSKFDTSASQAEIFLFDYGTVVIWGMTEAQEKRFLASIKRFEVEKLAPENVEMEDLNYYYANYSRIYNDVITLRKGSSYMTKLSLSHALSQSAKISLFEELISSTIEETKDIPEIISETGKIGMPHKEIMQKIGQLFLLRTNINSVGSVLDSPEVFWVGHLHSQRSADY